LAADPTAACIAPPHSKNPERLSASTKNSTASALTNHGDCSWNPQPICSPAARRASIAPARARKLATSPKVKAPAWRRRVSRSCVEMRASPSALSPSTGNTQGMRFNARPPTNAKTSATLSDSAPLAFTPGAKRATLADTVYALVAVPRSTQVATPATSSGGRSSSGSAKRIAPSSAAIRRMRAWVNTPSRSGKKSPFVQCASPAKRSSTPPSVAPADAPRLSATGRRASVRPDSSAQRDARALRATGRGTGGAAGSRQADLPAFEPIGARPESDRSALAQTGRNAHLDREQYLALEAEIDEMRDRYASGVGERHRTGGKSLRQLRRQCRRIARIARVLPVDVPLRVERDAQSELYCRAGDERGLRRDELGFGVRRPPARGCRRRPGRGGA